MKYFCAGTNSPGWSWMLVVVQASVLSALSARNLQLPVRQFSLLCVCCSEEDDEITLYPDDIITDIERIEENWWIGTAPDGTRGMFPSNYVEELVLT